MNTIQEMWESYRKQVIPADASAIQIRECRFAFYGGAQSILSITYNIGDKSISNDAGVQMLEGLHQEVQMFGATQCHME